MSRSKCYRAGFRLIPACLLVGGAGAVSAHLIESSPMYLAVGCVCLLLGAFLVLARQVPYLDLAQDKLVVKRSLGRSRAYQLGEIDSWKATEYPDEIVLYRSGEAVASIPLDSLPFRERERFLEALNALLPGESVGM